MLKTLAVSSLLLGSAIAYAQPPAAWGRSDNRNNNSYSSPDNRSFSESRNRGYAENQNYGSSDRGWSRGRGEVERGDWREHERFEHRFHRYANSYRGGYGDQRFGYYDRFGNWCQY